MPPPPASVPAFSVIPGAQVARALGGREKQLVELVEDTYRAHGAGATVNPPSYFLRFPDRPSSRIIALPASLGSGDGTGVDGIKWISSFPENVARGVPRASAVLILNDPVTGYPYACLESSIISATRTAASAASAAERLSRDRDRPRRVGFVGTGLIARYIHQFLVGTGWTFDEVGVFDLSADSAEGFRGHVQRTAPGEVRVHDSVESLVRGSDLVVFATVAGTPHVHDPAWFDHHPLVLNVSLRDLSAEIVLSSFNVLDDVEHCLKADTSPHLAEQATGNRDFVDGTLDQVLDGTLAVPTDRTVVFSPFGLGVLDLAVGRFVHAEVARAGELHTVDDFFHELSRHG
ncbi:2,3-diaminopropionate biosynthesis protein SbnB [Pseudonocardia sp. HH130629-09]|uniref:2,3-diaminopropionate biosynthesis protein SbnB n=1 Tax=Pseudonocardia sp. HH130629-09 TaxID=1641402 RepID=UPI0006CB1282|nr:2,3-diaminopropionate biosynthesis protein SbnB [Pseudonocardia sp. HH130629-09]ALE83833.1 ornithine cyclodeaminase [Pseudonocardia sp. HH130629-09]